MNASKASLTLMILMVIAAMMPARTHAAGAATVVRAVTKYFGKESAGEATEWMAKQGSKEAVERLATKASKEGGEAVVDQVAEVATKYGPTAIQGLDNAPVLKPVLGAIDELPAEQAGKALTRLAAGAEGRELAEAVTRYGSGAIRAELKHPGVGVRFATQLGDEGIVLAEKLTTDQAIAIGRHVDDIARLPQAQRGALLTMISEQSDRFANFVGDFVMKNPGKTLFTAATTGVVLANRDAILGGDEIVFDAEGNPIVVSKSGIIERAGARATTEVSERVVSPLIRMIIPLVASIVAVYAAIKLYGVWRKQQQQMNP